MRSTTVVIAKPVAACWRAFTDAALLPAWLPGVRKVRVIRTGSDNLPAEVQFETAESLTYSLEYTYDEKAGEVRWEPRIGKRDGVRGFARLEAEGSGTKLTYGLEEGAARRASDVGEPTTIVAAFAAWIERR